MNNHQINFLFVLFFILVFSPTDTFSQRLGGLPRHTLTNKLLLSDGPKGPIKGGESAVTDMVLMPDGWVYGSTMATWGAENCHVFRTDGDSIEHVLNVSTLLPGQTSIGDLEGGLNHTLYGGTTTSDEVFDTKNNSYEGGHLFTLNTNTGAFTDLGIVEAGQGINCIALDSMHQLLYAVTYPGGHLFSYDLATKSFKDFGEIMTPWRVKDLGRVSWRGVPKVLMLDEAGTLYFSTYLRTEVELDEQEKMQGAATSYSSLLGGRIYRLSYGEDHPVFTGAIIPTQTGMDSDPLYENGIASAIRAREGGFWCGTINDGFLFRFIPSTSTIINKGKTFQYWNLKSLAYGGDGNLYMLGGRDEDNSWIMSYDPVLGSLACLGWPENTAQCNVICADKEGRILIAENLRHSFMWVFDPEMMGNK